MSAEDCSSVSDEIRYKIIATYYWYTVTRAKQMSKVVDAATFAAAVAILMPIITHRGAVVITSVTAVCSWVGARTRVRKL